MRAFPDRIGQQEVTFEKIAWRYRLAIPIINAVAAYVQAKKALFGLFKRKPKINSYFFDGISINGRRVKDGAARWPALNACYNFVKVEGQTTLAQKVDAWWMNIRNAQAVRNRLKLAKAELHKAIDAFAKRRNPVRILSLAAGTAQGVIEVGAECNARGIATEIVLLDQDVTSLGYAQELADRLGVTIRTIAGDVFFFTRSIGDFQADIVEMMGLVDYLKDGLAVQLISKIRLYLKTDGYFFTCHIHDNSERYFLKYVVDWDMIYRSRDELKDLLARANFHSPVIITEPHGIHSVAVAQKV